MQKIIYENIRKLNSIWFSLDLKKFYKKVIIFMYRDEKSNKENRNNYDCCTISAFRPTNKLKNKE